jgi:Arc/MetJ-type ribon-helix-helix transcriptional regulator
MPAKPFQLNDDVVDLVRAEIDGERFKTESDVVRESLIALKQRDKSFEAWLREAVVPIAEEMKAHPERALSFEEVQDSLDQHHRKRLQSQ